MSSNRFDYNGDDEQDEQQEQTVEETDETEEDDEEEKEDEELTFEEQILKNHLRSQFKKVEAKVNTKQVPILSKQDKQVLEQAKQDKSLKAQATALELKRTKKLGQFILKMLQYIAPAIPFLLLFGIIILAAVAIASAVDSLFGGLFGGGSGGSGNMNSQFGADGNNFYAVRLIYKGDEQASKIILNDYANLIYGALDSVQGTDDYTINVNITIPADKKADFDETTADEKIKNLMGVLTEKAYVYDNPNYASLGVDISTLTLAQKAKDIKYFGLDSALIGQFKTEIVDNFVLFNFNMTDGVLTFTPTGENSVDENTVKANIQAALDAYFAGQNTSRSEKYFVRDCALSGDEKLTNVEQKNYVAMMYLPRQNVTFKSIKFLTYGVDTSNFKIEFNGNEYSSFEDWKIDDDNTAYEYTIGENLSYSASAVSNFDATIAATPTALYKLADKANYTQTNADGILTFQEFGTVFKFHSSQSFTFADEIELE